MYIYRTHSAISNRCISSYTFENSKLLWFWKAHFRHSIVENLWNSLVFLQIFALLWQKSALSKLLCIWNAIDCVQSGISSMMTYGVCQREKCSNVRDILYFRHMDCCFQKYSTKYSGWYSPDIWPVLRSVFPPGRGIGTKHSQRFYRILPARVYSVVFQAFQSLCIASFSAPIPPPPLDFMHQRDLL